MLHLASPSFKQIRDRLRAQLVYNSELVSVGEWQAIVEENHPASWTYELRGVSLEFPINSSPETWEETVRPNMPWAEMHFQERVSGEPLNPPPSHEHWPFARKDNEAFRKNDQFSHTYPERFWPRFANIEGTIRHSERQVFVPHVGLRFEYGDLGDLVKLLLDRPGTRQAYLPVWFPEDLAACQKEERVPCSLGYHFILRNGRLHCTYYMRSCDFVRHFTDDVYMAGRLTQWICDQMQENDVAMHGLQPGDLTMHVVSMHIFKPDMQMLRRQHDH